MTIITQLTDHLTAELVTGGDFKTARHAQAVKPFDDLDAARLPAVEFYIGDETSEASNADNRISQRNTIEIWCFLTCAHSDQFERGADLKAALLGYQLDPEWDAMQHTRGEIMKLTGDYITVRHVFSTWRQVSETN